MGDGISELYEDNRSYAEPPRRDPISREAARATGVDDPINPKDAPMSEEIKQPPRLTEREMEVAMLLVSGKNNGDIAIKLDISTKTVDTHRGHILKKLGLKNNVELVWYALREKWVSL